MPDDMVGLSFVGWVEGGQLSKPLVRQVFDYGDDLLVLRFSFCLV
jgi:hypothetical protein